MCYHKKNCLFYFDFTPVEVLLVLDSVLDIFIFFVPAVVIITVRLVPKEHHDLLFVLSSY